MQPNPAALREAHEWLDRAERDLAVARQVVVGPPALPDMCAYHCQQAAEKAFKAFLTAVNTPFRRTHDLVELQAQCQAIDAHFGRFLAAAQALNPYATRFRYPGGPLEPPPAEARQALQLAWEIVTFVQQAL